MRRLSWIITIPFTLVVVVFAISNRGPVTVTLWPLPWIVELPLYLVVLGSLLVGFLVGGAIAWLSAGRRRHEARVTAERLRGMSAELTRLKRQQLDGSTARLPAPR